MVETHAFLGYGVELTSEEELELMKRYEVEDSGSGDIMLILNELLISNMFGWMPIDSGGCIFYLEDLSTIAGTTPIQVTFDINEIHRNAITFFKHQTGITSEWKWHLMVDQC